VKAFEFRAGKPTVFYLWSWLMTGFLSLLVIRCQPRIYRDHSR